MSDLKNYPGNKSSLSILPRLINLMPKCKLFVDLFAGSGIIVKSVYDAGRDSEMKFIANDIDFKVVKILIRQLPGNIVKINCDFRNILDSLDLLVKIGYVCRDEIFIYADPPYVISSRKRLKIYLHEMQDYDHVQMFRALKEYGFKTMISGYDSKLYQELFKGWYTRDFKVSTHSGTAIEKVWMNYDITTAELVTYDYAGHNFIQRQQYKRKRQRFLKKIMELPKIEREMLLRDAQALIVKNNY